MPFDRHLYHEAIRKQVHRAEPHGEAQKGAMPVRKLEAAVEHGDIANANFVNQCGKSLIGLAKIGTMKT